MNEGKREELRREWRAHHEIEENEMETDTERELRIYTAYNKACREREEREARGEKPKDESAEIRARLNELDGGVVLGSSLSAAKVYEQRKQARIKRQLAPPPSRSYQDEEDEEQPKATASLPDASVVYEQRADARKRRMR